MKFKSRLKKGIASTLVAGTLLSSSPVWADSLGGWMQIVGSGVGGLMSLFFTPNSILQMGTNVDAAQTAAEGLVLAAMKDVTHEWEPEPKDSYQSAAKNNDDGAKTSVASVCTGDDGTALTFEVQALTAVGLETSGLTNLNAISAGRPYVVSDLSKMKADETDLLSADTTSDETLTQIGHRQNKNYQWISTAGIARAELGLKTAYQAAADAAAGSGGTGSDETPTSGTSDNDVQMVADQNFIQNQTLTQLPGSVTSTAQAMSVQALMNMELAQRLNLSNALQSNILSIEAARGLRNAGTRRNN